MTGPQRWAQWHNARVRDFCGSCCGTGPAGDGRSGRSTQQQNRALKRLHSHRWRARRAGADDVWAVSLHWCACSFTSAPRGYRWFQANRCSPHALWLAGSAFRGPPLLLSLLAPTARHTYLYCLPCILADLLAAVCLLRITRRLYSKTTATVRTSAAAVPVQPPSASLHPNKPQLNPCPAPRELSTASAVDLPPGSTADARTTAAAVTGNARLHVTPTTVAALFLWNPYTLAVCVSGGTGSLSTAAVLVAVAGAVDGAPVVTALGCAGASYLDPLCLLLVVRCLLTALPACIPTGTDDHVHKQGGRCMLVAFSGASYWHLPALSGRPRVQCTSFTHRCHGRLQNSTVDARAAADNLVCTRRCHWAC